MKTRYLPHGLLVLLIVLAATLATSAATAQRGGAFQDFPERQPKVGEMAPDFILKTVDGEPFTLSEAFAKQPVVIEFGSYT